MHMHSLMHRSFLWPDYKFPFWKLEIERYKKAMSLSHFVFPRFPFWYLNCSHKSESCTLRQGWSFLILASSTYQKGFIMNTYTPGTRTWVSYHGTRSDIRFCINNCSYPMENVRQLILRERNIKSFLATLFPRAHSVASHSHITGRSQEVACPVFHVQVHR